MNNTAALRERLRDITGTFQALDFADIPSSHAIITKMVTNGEVLLVSDARPKVYKVGKLKDHKTRSSTRPISTERAETVREVSPFVKAWSAVYPEFFRVPEFGGYKSMIRAHRE